MWNWIKFIGLFLLSLIAVLTIIIFSKGFSPYKDVEQFAEQLAVEKNYVQTVDRTTVYNGQHAYVTVYGTDQKGIKRAVFVPVEKEYRDTLEKYPMVVLKDGFPAEEAVKKVREKVEVVDVMHVRLGYEQEEPIWEIVTKGKKGEMNYSYLSFKDGKWKKNILNL